jgi:hypothetical protein
LLRLAGCVSNDGERDVASNVSTTKIVIVRRNYLVLIATGFCLLSPAHGQSQSSSYLGFDRNEYPADTNLKTLRQTFSYAGYWLNNPPGMSSNSWAGHRAAVEAAGFGFLVLFNGRLYAELKTAARATQLGRSDAQAAAAAAQREGFPRATIIFLDQEQGGRMLSEQKAYIYAWVDGVTVAGFRAGIYCSGMPSPDEGHVVTAEDIREHAGEGARATRQIAYWVTNDACPPSPGCDFPQHSPMPAQSGVGFAEVWQFAQSPRRKDVAAHCANYSRDGNCYPPGVSAAQGLHMDVNAAKSSDPSYGRTR